MGLDCLALVHWLAREATLVAAVGIAIGGADDLAIDAIYGARWLFRRSTGRRDRMLSDIPPGRGRLAILVGAWHEAGVIGGMVRTTLARFGDRDFRLYVGTYPNDRATTDEATAAAAGDPRVRVVVGPAPGPTSKADNLNTLWRALVADEAVEGPVAGVVLHDAEDVVHPRELDVYAAYLDRHDAVQLPVMPLVDATSPLVSGHYVDEFSEAHGKLLVVRQALGAGLPFAGVGCAIGRAMLGRIAAARAGLPFDADSLTEDYELGLTVAELGGTATLAWVTEADGRTPVAIRAYFPRAYGAAVHQKSRWVTGIALAGWDRTGWGGRRSAGEYWMRMHDRRGPLSSLVIVAAYAAFVLWGAAWIAERLGSRPLPPLDGLLRLILAANAALLLWRVAIRAVFTGKLYGWRQGLLAFPRMIAGNVIAVFAAVVALRRYVATLRGRSPGWGKTDHVFPNDVAGIVP